MLLAMVAGYFAGLRAVLVRRIHTSIAVSACISATLNTALTLSSPRSATRGTTPTRHTSSPNSNDLDEEPPGNFKSEHGVSVRYRVPPVHSRNQLFVPDGNFTTQAVLLSDVNVYYKPDDLEFVFQTWRNFEQNRLTGALAQCAVPREGMRWEYSACSVDAGQDAYSMIVTNLCFSHVSFPDFYSSDDPIMTKVRTYVDDHKGCESIAMNYMASYLTVHGHLLVQGRDKFVNLQAEESGAEQKPVSAETKSRCLNDSNEIFGCMPLVDETAFIQRGVGSP